MARVIWTPTARISLREIAAYIGREAGRPRAAEKVVHAIRQKCESHGRQPTMGSLHEDLPPPLRFFTHKRYVIVYESLTDGIRVLRVVDSARDWGPMFGSAIDPDEAD